MMRSSRVHQSHTSYLITARNKDIIGVQSGKVAVTPQYIQLRNPVHIGAALGEIGNVSLCLSSTALRTSILLDAAFD
jgi:hypothetical protein